MEVDEGMFYLGLLAASQRLPFLPTRAGLGSDVLRVNPGLRTVRSPYEDDEELVAMPALALDAAFVHVNRADTHGNGQVLGPDPFFDELFLGAAARRFVTAEKVVEPGRLLDEGPIQTVTISRLMTDAVAEVPGGAHFTACPPTTNETSPSRRPTPRRPPIPMPGQPSTLATSKPTRRVIAPPCTKRRPPPDERTMSGLVSA